MELVSIVLRVLGFLSFLGAIMGLIDPARLARKGKPAPSRGVAFVGGAGLAVILIVLGNALKADEPKPAAPPADASASVVGQKLEGNMSKEDIKAFSGADHIVPGGALASVTVPVTPEEAAFIDDRDGSKFLRYIQKRYPDVLRVKFRPTAAISEDRDTLAMYREHFYMGLYFAKQIQLADGQSLFDFLVKCSQKMDPLNSAELGFDKDGKMYFDMQYFPVLVHQGSGKLDDMNVIFERHGDVITARSPFFSSSILKSADYLSRHGLACAK